MPNLFDGDLARFNPPYHEPARSPSPPNLVQEARRAHHPKVQPPDLPFPLWKYPEVARKIRSRIRVTPDGHWLCSGTTAGIPGRPIIRIAYGTFYIARLLWEVKNNRALGSVNLGSLCGVPECVRPDPEHNHPGRKGAARAGHDLTIPTAEETLRVQSRPGRPRRDLCAQGHPMIEHPNGRRACRPCDARRRRDYERRRTARLRESSARASELTQAGLPVPSRIPEVELPLLRVVR